MEKLTTKHLGRRLAYGVKGALLSDQREDFSDLSDSIENYEEIFDKGAIWTLAGYADEDLCIPLGEGELDDWLWRNDTAYACFGYAIKPIFHPLSDLTKSIVHKGKEFVPIEKLVEERDCDAEYDFLHALEDDWASADDKIRFAPYSVIEKLFEWHFVLDEPEGTWIDVNTLETNPYN
jgi:hypothetical protein